MWRAVVLAIGLSLCVLGTEFMIVDRLIMARDSATNSALADPYFDNDYLGASDLTTWGEASTLGRRIFVPPEWAPWGLLSAGVITVLYGATLPVQGDD